MIKSNVIHIINSKGGYTPSFLYSRKEMIYNDNEII